MLCCSFGWTRWDLLIGVVEGIFCLVDPFLADMCSQKNKVFPIHFNMDALFGFFCFWELQCTLGCLCYAIEETFTLSTTNLSTRYSNSKRAGAEATEQTSDVAPGEVECERSGIRTLTHAIASDVNVCKHTDLSGVSAVWSVDQHVWVWSPVCWEHMIMAQYLGHMMTYRLFVNTFVWDSLIPNDKSAMKKITPTHFILG